MTRTLLLITLLLCIVGGTSLAAAVALSTPCAPVAVVEPVNSYANIRPEPNTTAQPVATIMHGTSAPVDAQSGSWWHLCQGGYVSGAVVQASTLTPTASATATQPTPTRLVTNTPAVQVITQTPAATLPLSALVMGTTIPCTNPCAIIVYAGTPLPTVTRLP